MAAVLEAIRPEVASVPICEDGTGPLPRIWTRDEFYRLAEAGILKPEEHVELVDGQILIMCPQGEGHANSTVLTGEVFRAAFGAGFHVREEKPFVISDHIELEPDIVVVRGSIRENLAHPTPATAALVIEISESSATYDLGRKAAHYARAVIEDYWVVNLNNSQLVVHRDPGDLGNGLVGYRSTQVFTRGMNVSPLAKSDATIRVDDLLPQTPEPAQQITS